MMPECYTRAGGYRRLQNSVATFKCTRFLAVAFARAWPHLTPRGVIQFLGVSQEKPPPLFTDNDGTWYVSRDAASTVNMTYIIRHVRTLQQAEHDGEICTCTWTWIVLDPPAGGWRWVVVRMRAMVVPVVVEI